ncbi:phospholipase A and acyltransferase 1-like [Camarhynchus parvulus]|uniref:phospholipase A and acyltransferase 1-like n=1 Tax=Geospiza parvula TaxID=87175 RepID=UPI001237B269|nr:phospholipase A and acyltransferase 1-like [Camarhynchus parvulus]
MHVSGRAEDKDYPSPGDLIEVKWGRYEHWALYLAKGHVLHVIPDEGATHLSPSSGSVFLRKAMVKKADLELVAGNDTWRVNNKYDRSRTPFPMEEIIRRSEPWIGKELAYRLFLKNCEHFVTMLRYGDGVSEQANTALLSINSISSVVMAGIGIAGLVAAAGIPAFGFPLLASCAVSGGGSLASIGLTSSNIVHYVSFAKFAKAGRDILEKSCC